MTNLLLDTWDTPFGLTPFDKISDDDFAPAVGVALANHKAEIGAITATADPATFANTVEALEAVGRDLDKVLSVHFSPSTRARTGP